MIYHPSAGPRSGLPSARPHPSSRFMYRRRRFNNARFTVSPPSGRVGRVLQTQFRAPACVYKPARGREMACRRACCQSVNRSVVIKWACSASPARRCAHWAELAPAASFGQSPPPKLPVDTSDPVSVLVSRCRENLTMESLMTAARSMHT